MGAEPARIVAAPRSALGGAAPKREAAEATPLPAPPPREDRGPTTATAATARPRPRPPDRGDRGPPTAATAAPAPRRPPVRRPATAPTARGDRGRAGDRGPRRDDRARARDAARPAAAPSCRRPRSPQVTTARGSLAMERAELEAAEATPEALAAGKEILETLMGHLGFEGVDRRDPRGRDEPAQRRRRRRRPRGPGLADRPQGRAPVGAPAPRQPDALAPHRPVDPRARGRRGLPRPPRAPARATSRRVPPSASIETGKMLQLEPMPALERRWIHLALRDNADVVDAVDRRGAEPPRRRPAAKPAVGALAVARRRVAASPPSAAGPPGSPAEPAPADRAHRPVPARPRDRIRGRVRPRRPTPRRWPLRAERTASSGRMARAISHASLIQFQL